MAGISRAIRCVHSLPSYISIGSGNQLVAEVAGGRSTVRIFGATLFAHEQARPIEAALLYNWEEGSPLSSEALALHIQNVCGHRLLAYSVEERVKFYQRTFGFHPVARNEIGWLMAHPELRLPFLRCR